MSSREYKLYIKDILVSIAKIEKFVGDMASSEFEKDEKTSDAVIRRLEIIGEAVKQIPSGIKNKYKTVDWKGMAGMRDKLIHGYFGVDYDILWKVIKEDLPSVRPMIKKILEEV